MGNIHQTTVAYLGETSACYVRPSCRLIASGCWAESGRRTMIKQALLALFLSVPSGAIYAQQADPCAGLVDSALAQCRGNQQTLQQQHLEQQLQQQQQRQNQLDEQQREIQQQLDDIRVQNELLRKQLEQEKAAKPPALPQALPPVSTSAISGQSVSSRTIGANSSDARKLMIARRKFRKSEHT